MTTFRRLADEPDPAGWVAVALPWIREAGLPYTDWLLGGAAAGAELARWVARPSSELYIGRATLLSDDGGSLGGFIAMPGSELPACRRADALAAVGAAGDRAGLIERLRAAEGLFAPVEPSDFYLSRLGIDPGGRGRGLGVALVREYLRRGAELGFARFRLDVSADNAAAIALYRREGFEVASEGSEAGMKYVAMALGPEIR